MRPLRIATAALLLALALSVSMAAAHAAPAGRADAFRHGRCFPARLWNSGTVPDRFRPCARILRVMEDGSVKVGVFDRSGVERYNVNIGAADR